MNTQDTNQHLDALSDIKDIMERSSRFLSLSGLSGVLAGLFALMGAGAAYFYFELGFFGKDYYSIAFGSAEMNRDFLIFYFVDGLTVLGLSLFFAFFLSYRKARKQGIKINTRATRLMFFNMAIPLSVGGAFVFILVYHNILCLVAPSTLVFYGLALISASKYTLNDIKGLGLFEIALGLIGMVFTGYGLMIWTIGFGVLHIIYGIVMWYKYDRQPKAAA